MAKKLLVKGNYLIYEIDGTEKMQFALTKTVYTIANNKFLLKEDIDGKKLSIPFSDVGDFVNDSDTAFTEETLTTFLQENTGKSNAGNSSATPTEQTITSIFHITASAVNENNWIGHKGIAGYLSTDGRLSVFSEQNKTIFINKGYDYGYTHHFFRNRKLKAFNVSILDIGVPTFNTSPQIELIIWANRVDDNAHYDGDSNPEGIVIYNDFLPIDNTYVNTQYNHTLSNLDINIPAGYYIAYGLRQVNWYGAFYCGSLNLKIE